jgi:FMN-dependent oxidoreductase (nitrilotriacetate monooxygenase family)
MTPQKQLHLNLNMLNAGVYGGAWRSPETDPRASFDFEHYVHLAKLSERAKLDAVFLADGLLIADDARFRPFQSLEPTVLLAYIAASTEHIGLIGTISTSYSDPFNLARRLATLDHVSRGRTGWNIVTTVGDRAAQNFGSATSLSHRDRYVRAQEYLEVALKLWESFPSEAVTADKRSGEYLDLDLVLPINHSGEHFQIRGPLNVPRSPQGRPVLVQAGASSDGKGLAARFAEVIFTVQKTIPESVSFAKEIRCRAAEFGRRPELIKILPGLSTVIGSTESEALARRRDLEDLVHPDYARGRLAEQLGLEPSELVLDEQLPAHLEATEDTSIQSSQSFRTIVINQARREGLTVRQLLRALGGGAGHRIVTGTPEQIADDMQDWFVTGAADGFNVMPDVLPTGAVIFLEQVVPELQRRGLFRREYTGHTLRDHYGLPALSDEVDELTSEIDSSSVASGSLR